MFVSIDHHDHPVLIIYYPINHPPHMAEGVGGDDGGDGEADPKLTVFGTTIPAESAYDRDAPRVDINVDGDEVFNHAPLAIVDADLLLSLSLGRSGSI